MAHGQRVTLTQQITVATAITVLQVKAGTSLGFQIIEAWCTQDSSTTSAMEEIVLLRKSAAATVTAAVLGTNLVNMHNDAGTPDLDLSTSGTGHTATVEGTDDDILVQESFNVLAGWKYQPIPESRIRASVGEIVGLKFLSAPASHDFQFGIVLEEV
jgi:hypothetical protein